MFIRLDSVYLVTGASPPAGDTLTGAALVLVTAGTSSGDTQREPQVPPAV